MADDLFRNDELAVASVVQVRGVLATSATVTPGGAEIRAGFSLPPPIVFGYTPRCAVVVVEGAAG